MSTVHDILHRHIGNAEELCSLFDDLVHAQFSPWLVEKFRFALDAERAALETHKENGDRRAAKFCRAECEKLAALIAELEAVKPPDDETIMAAIERRYMINPLRSKE